jgi:hypothetical protein
MNKFSSQRQNLVAFELMYQLIASDLLLEVSDSRDFVRHEASNRYFL